MKTIPQVDLTPLKMQLANRLDDLIACLFKDRMIHKSAHEYRIGNNGSISIRRDDGAFSNFETGEAGDIFALIQSVLKTDFKGALIFARSFAGGNDLLPVPNAPYTSRCKKDDARAQQRLAKAMAILGRCKPIKGTLGEHYFREYRSINGDLPDDLGFIEYCYNYTASGFYPGVTAVIRNVRGEKIAAQVIFLDPATGNKLAGSNIKCKLIFGACRGGAVQLAKPSHKLTLVEGIEDSLSIMQCCPEMPVWATGGTSGLINAEIPDSVREVTLCGDNDEAGRNAVKKKTTMLIGAGKVVSTVFPPDGFKDWNDLLRSEL